MSEMVKEQMAEVAELHRKMDGMGVSHSVYGQAARESFIRQQLGSGGAGNPADLHEAARRMAAQQIVGAPLDNAAANARIAARVAFPGVVGERKNRIQCHVIGCSWGSETDGAMAAHLAAVHGLANGVTQSGERRFTRAEVLLILRAIEASRGGVSEAITAFERME